MLLKRFPVGQVEVEDLGIFEEYVYDIEVEDNHNFFANDICVHNSVYVDLSPLVEKFAGDRPTPQVVDFINKAAESKIQKVISDGYSELVSITNSESNFIDMKREAIGPALFVTKKNYIMRVFDDEGVRLSKPKMKIMGLEGVRSTIPEWCRNAIKDSYEHIFTHGESDMIELISHYHSEFMNLPLSDIGMATGVKDISKWLDANGDLISGAPYHVKAAVAYNRMIDKQDLGKMYEKIKDGDKVKLITVKMPNPAFNEILAFPERIPPELGMDKYIDREAQFEKTYLNPMKRVLSVVGWNTEEKVSLEDFFS